MLKAVRWWPPVGLTAMVLLGLAVGNGSTRVDDFFLDTGENHPVLDWLLLFTWPRVLVTLVGVALIVALWRRRWRLAAVVALAPLVGIAAARALKYVFGRYKGEPPELAYPSGHLTATVVVLGMLVLVLGAPRWAVLVATLWTVPAMLGLAFTFHYFTDTVGAVLLGTSLVCIAIRVAGLDRCQPGCDLGHSHG